MKAAVDFEIDLRNRDAIRTCDQGHVDNQTISLATDGGKLRQHMLLMIVFCTGKQFPEITHLVSGQNIPKRVQLYMPTRSNSD